MSFDRDKQTKAIQWLKEKCPDLKCDCCGKNDWNIAEDIATLIPMKGTRIQFGGLSYPVFMIFCKNCFNVKMFSAVQAGVAGKIPDER